MYKIRLENSLTDPEKLICYRLIDFPHEIHRLDGPAAEWISGQKQWYLNGKIHREDGPAVERPDGTVAYYLDGKLQEPSV